MRPIHILLSILVPAALTFGLRALPFLLLNKRELPKRMEYLGKVFPMAIMATLVIYCLKSIPESTLQDNLILLAGVALVVLTTTVSAFALMENVSTINTDRTGSFDIYKYDITNAEKDGVWDSSYVSTGVRDPGVEDILGSDTRKSSLDANGEVNGYAIKGVEFTYLKVADIRT